MSEANREAFEKAVADMSPLTVSQVEVMFGEFSQSNRGVIWRFL